VRYPQSGRGQHAQRTIEQLSKPKLLLHPPFTSCKTGMVRVSIAPWTPTCARRCLQSGMSFCGPMSQDIIVQQPCRVLHDLLQCHVVLTLPQPQVPAHALYHRSDTSTLDPHSRHPIPNLPPLQLNPNPHLPDQRLPPLSALQAFADAGARAGASRQPSRQSGLTDPEAYRTSFRGHRHPQHQVANCPGGPHELGSNARIGHRAARRYGIQDRWEWMECRRFN
jgi:hypothetical protein